MEKPAFPGLFSGPKWAGRLLGRWGLAEEDELKSKGLWTAVRVDAGGCGGLPMLMRECGDHPNQAWPLAYCFGASIWRRS